MTKELEQGSPSGVTPISPHGQNVLVASPVLHFLQQVRSHTNAAPLTVSRQVVLKEKDCLDEREINTACRKLNLCIR